MLTIKEMQAEILRLKKENDICILAHAYQSHDIWEVADYVGDSYGLSLKAAEAPQKTVIMCGVRFMAETVKILAPEKKVILAHPLAGCPMAQQYTKEDVIKLREENPGYAVVAYINTTSELKTACDVCVTSSAAKNIVKNMEEKDIIFIPDPNLGSYIRKQVPEKNIKLVNGGCPAHSAVSADTAYKAKKAHPNALLLVHPECREEIAEMADYVGSTTGIMDFAKKSEAKEFIIGTENSIIEHLQYECPGKRFYPLSAELICANMKLTTLGEVYSCAAGIGGEEIDIPEDVMHGAKRCIERMLELGGK